MSLLHIKADKSKNECDKYIMLDTSQGHVDPVIYRNNFTETRPLQDLRRLLDVVGVSPDDISMVVHSHIHPDHIGWNV